MLKLLLDTIGITLCLLPKPILKFVCVFLSLVTLLCLSSKRRLVKQNFKLSFPKWSNARIAKSVFISTSRTIEQGLLSFAWPFISEGKLIESFMVSSDSQKLINEKNTQGGGIIWLIPHFCHADAISFLKPEIQVNALYRPLRNPVFDDFVKKSRQRFGVRTIDRKDGGMLKTLKVLKKGEILAMLFDQNAGGAGTRLSFMGRECSCTTLPDILNEKFKPRILFVFTRRIGFWRSSIEVEEMESLNDGQLVIERANAWLEGKLRDDKQLQESWLWMHQRWKPGAGQPRKGKIR